MTKHIDAAKFAQLARDRIGADWTAADSLFWQELDSRLTFLRASNVRITSKVYQQAVAEVGERMVSWLQPENNPVAGELLAKARLEPDQARALARVVAAYRPAGVYLALCAMGAMEPSCLGCGRPESTCSLNPCDAVEADRLR